MNTKKPFLPFGQTLGFAPGNVPAFSSDYATVDHEKLTDRHAYRHYVDGIFTGYKWQCVEFARRWLLVNKGYVFDDIAMAYDIFNLTVVSDIKTGEKLPLKSFENGSLRFPEPGCMLIWNEGGEFDVTGHVAIVTEVQPTYIRVAEQNVEYTSWENQPFSRELPAVMSPEGNYWIQCSYTDASILGWVIQTEDSTHAIEPVETNSKLLNLHLSATENKVPHPKAWLNVANPDEAAYVRANGYQLSSHAHDQDKYFCMSKTAQKELKRATNECHALIMHATDYVLQNDKILAKFNLPKEIWPKIHQSWDNRRNEMVTGRLDFCLSEQGLKLYEYNADSASCHIECGKIQGLWAQHFDCDDGEDAGNNLFKSLAQAWHDLDILGTVHLMLDNDEEETYHALFMKSIMESVGIQTKLLRGMNDVQWSNTGQVLDADGEVIERVWKTWAWETALDQLRHELSENTINSTFCANQTSKPRLVDVLLMPQTLVFEPLWTLIPSNKAILPILWDIAPNHPYLIESQFELTPALQKNGYVRKPIAGRCGYNIQLIDNQSKVINETAGQFGHQEEIFQQLWKLPNIAGYNTQICTFTAAGRYAGACVRVDDSLIITKNSDILPLRVIHDKYFISRK